MTMPKTTSKPKQKTKAPAKRKKAPPRPAAKAPADAPKKPTPEPKPAKGRKREGKKPAAKATGTGAAKGTSKPKAAAQGDKPCGTGKCAPKKCGSGTCPTRKQLDGRSLFDRARECKDLEECRRFIVEFNEAVEQANQWLDDMHAQALSAEEARDVYGAQISDLLEAIDIDRARIAELEAELKKARATSPKSAAPDAALAQLAELSREVQAIRKDLQRLLEGRAPSSQRRQRVRAVERASTGRRGGRPPKTAAAKAATPTAEDGGALVTPAPVRTAAKTARRGAHVAPGTFAKHSVLRGAACSLGVGKYGYPPEVCAPASFSRSDAAQILGTYAQHNYGGLAKWALITGLPIDDVVVPLSPQPAGRRRPARTPTSNRKPPTASGQQRAASSAKARRGKPSKSSEERSNRQILDQVLLTVARV
jgi:hypothetical protein